MLQGGRENSRGWCGTCHRVLERDTYRPLLEASDSLGVENHFLHVQGLVNDLKRRQGGGGRMSPTGREGKFSVLSVTASRALHLPFGGGKQTPDGHPLTHQRCAIHLSPLTKPLNKGAGVGAKLPYSSWSFKGCHLRFPLGNPCGDISAQITKQPRLNIQFS